MLFFPHETEVGIMNYILGQQLEELYFYQKFFRLYVKSLTVFAVVLGKLAVLFIR